MTLQAKTTPTQLVNAIGWLERRNIDIVNVRISGRRPVLKIENPHEDLISRAQLLIEKTRCGISHIYTATIQDCIIYWR